MTSHLGGQAAPRLQRPKNALEDGIGMVFHPVQGGIRKGCIEFRFEPEMVGIHEAGVHASPMSRKASDHLPIWATIGRR